MAAQPLIPSEIAGSRLHRVRGPAAVALAVAAALMFNPGRAEAAATLASGPLPNVTPEARASELVQPATVFVQVNWDAQVTVPEYGVVYRERWETGCTGFVVNPDGYIVTAGHCLDDGREGAQHDATELVADDLVHDGLVASADRDALIEDVDVGNVRWKIEGKLADSRPDREVHVSVGGGKAQWNGATDAVAGVSARVLDDKPWSEGDVGLLKIEDSDLPVAVLATKSDVQVGEQILAVGYPLQFAELGRDVKIALTNRRGQINSVDTQGEHGPGNLFYETSAALTPGQSGGPAVDLQGNVVGLASFQQGAAYFIVPSSVIAEVIAGRVKNAPGRIDALYREGLNDYYHGYYTDATTKFEQVLSIMPNLQPAIDKKLAAAQGKQRFGDQPKPQPPAPPASSSQLPRVAFAAGGGLALIALVVAVVLWRRRRRRRAALPSPSTTDIAMAAQAFTGSPNRHNPAAEGVLGSNADSAGEHDADEERADEERALVGQLNVAPVSGVMTGAADSLHPTRVISPHTPGDGGPDTMTGREPETVAGFAAEPFSAHFAGDDVNARSPVASPLTVERFCPRCGAERAPGAIYCSRCGSQLHQPA